MTSKSFSVRYNIFDYNVATPVAVLRAFEFFYLLHCHYLGSKGRPELSGILIVKPESLLGLRRWHYWCVYHVSKIPLKYVKKYALPLAITSLLVTALVFVPGIGSRSGGAVRWIDLGFISFQPVEILKYSIIIYYAAWLAYSEPLRENIKYTLLPLVGILAVVGGLLLAQPDTDNFMIITVVCMLMYFISGAPWKHILLICVGGLALGGILILNRPYIFDRLTTFLDPTHDPLGSSYQVQQSLIAVGSGKITGRGFGQSIQKYKYLPEPLSDSIYAVMAEEFGFVGAIVFYLALH
jgi:cell division protein FtsW